MGGNDKSHSRKRELRREVGLSLLEVLVITPLIIVLLLSAVEASFFLFQHFDVRSAAQEVGRLAAENDDSSVDIAQAVCESMVFQEKAFISLRGDKAGIGENVEATVTRSAHTLTGFVYLVLDPPIEIVSRATLQIEDAPTVWIDGTFTCQPIVTASAR